MKILIAGSRQFFYQDVNEYGRSVLTPLTLKQLEDLIEEAMGITGYTILVTEIVSGMANGIDNAAVSWAVKNKTSIKSFPANWDKYKKSAGFIRNSEMAKYADALVAIWDGESKGTAHMIKEMRRLRKPVDVFVFDSSTARLNKLESPQPYPDPSSINELFGR